MTGKIVNGYYQTNIKTSRNEDSVYAMRYANQQMLIDKLQQENQELKKQLEEYKEEKQEWINLLDMFKNQQKKFIEYLENEKDRLARECSQIYEDNLGKTRLVSEDIFNEVNYILQNYKCITGVLDEESNNISS